MPKNERLFVPIKNKLTQHQIKTVMDASGMTYEQLIDKYLKLPNTGDLELLECKHEDVKTLYKEYVCEENKKCTHELFEHIWVILANTALGDYDSSKLIIVLEQFMSEQNSN